MSARTCVIGFTVILLFTAMTALATVPGTISFQGRLTNAAGQTVPDGTYSVTFTIYDLATEGTNWWTETQSVATVAGLFSVQLGSIVPLVGLPQHFGTADRWLGIKVGTDPEMTPRHKFTAVPYALVADFAPHDRRLRKRPDYRNRQPRHHHGQGELRQWQHQCRQLVICGWQHQHGIGC